MSWLLRKKAKLMKTTGYTFRMRHAALLAFVLIFAGCGYAFAPKGESIDPAIRNIYVEPFGNKTAHAEVENFMRTAFIDQVLQHSRFKAVEDSAKAHAVISGNIIGLNTVTLSYRQDILAAEERMTALLEVVFRETEGGKIIWASSRLTGNVDYKVSNAANPLPFRKQALRKLSKDLAESAFNMMMSNF